MSNEIKRSIDGEIERKQSKKQRHSTDQNEVSSRERAKDLLNAMKQCDPVLSLSLSEEESFDIAPTSNKILGDFLHPLSPSDFKSNCFRKKAVHVRSNRKERVDGIISDYMFGLDPKQIFEETSSDSVFLWIPSKDKNEASCTTSQTKSLQSIDIQDPNTAHILHTNSNYSSYCRAPPELEQLLVSNMLRETGFGLGQYDPTGEKLTTLGRGEVETFIGTKGHVTDWHTDFQENFTLQLSGRKKWSLKQGTIKHPIRGTTPHYRSSSDVIENQIKAARLSNPNYQFGKQDLDSNAFGNEVEIVMDAGDVLYFPAGMWHKVETLEEGVSINISLMGTTYASLFCKTLEHLLLEKDEWREVICSHADKGFDTVEKLKGLIESLPSILEKTTSNIISKSILPPALRQPPAFQVVGNTMDADQVSIEMEDEKVEKDIPAGEESGESDAEECALDCEDNKENLSTNDEDEMIVDIEEFEMPERFRSENTSQKDWKRNPLASLMRMSDVKSFFEGEMNKNLFILNINFAGNEMHESAIRVVLRDGSGQLEHLCSLEGKNLDEAIKQLETPPDALVYYGYVV